MEIKRRFDNTYRFVLRYVKMFGRLREIGGYPAKVHEYGKVTLCLHAAIDGLGRLLAVLLAEIGARLILLMTRFRGVRRHTMRHTHAMACAGAGIAGHRYLRE